MVGPTQKIGPHFCANCSQALNVGVLQGKETLSSFFNKLCKLAQTGKQRRRERHYKIAYFKGALLAWAEKLQEWQEVKYWDLKFNLQKVFFFFYVAVD